jgi:hypothetical protein
VRHGAVERGWIPEAIPPTATEIQEQHDPDTNATWVRFTLLSSDRDHLTTGLESLSFDKVLQLKIRRPSAADWWFENLVQQAPANDNALNAHIYRVPCGEGRQGYFALDRSSPAVFYWCTM